MTISIIIPTYNEEDSILRLLNHLKINTNRKYTEILVVDGKSTDRTVEKIQRAGIKWLRSEKKGRAAQMNLGVQQSTGEILYFVHADAIPPRNLRMTFRRQSRMDSVQAVTGLPLTGIIRCSRSMLFLPGSTV